MSRQLRRLGLSKTIEVFVETSAKTVFNFSDNILLLDKVLTHAIYISLNCSKSLAFNDMMQLLAVNQGYITLAGYKNEQYNVRLPFNMFPFGVLGPTGAVGAPGGFSPFFFKPKLISYRNSFIEFPAGSIVVPAGGLAVQLTIFYEPYNENVHQLNNWGELIEPAKTAPSIQPPPPPIKHIPKLPNFKHGYRR